MTTNGPPLPAPTPWAAPQPAPPTAAGPAGWPAPQWQPLAPPPRRTTNGWAVVTLVAGLLAVVPLALGAGIAALVQIRRRGQAGVGLAVAGLVAAAVWTAVGVVAIVGLVFLGSGSGAALGRVADADSAVVGDCLFAPPADRSIATISSCNREHDAEVYLVSDLGAGAWPGFDALDGRADDLCYQAYAGYVGKSFDDSRYDFGYFLPDEGEWSAGEHHAVCAVLPRDGGTLTTSVRGSGR